MYKYFQTKNIIIVKNKTYLNQEGIDKDVIRYIFLKCSLLLFFFLFPRAWEGFVFITRTPLFIAIFLTPP